MVILIRKLHVGKNKNKMEDTTSAEYITTIERRALDNIENKMHTISAVARKVADDHREKRWLELVNKARIVCFFANLVEQDLKILEQVQKK